MTKTLRPEEDAIRRTLATSRCYPRWKYMRFTKGFCYYLAPNRSVQEVFKHWDGRWSAGKEYNGTFRYFDTLQAALDYGVRMSLIYFKETRLAGAASDPSKLPSGITATRIS